MVKNVSTDSAASSVVIWNYRVDGKGRGTHETWNPLENLPKRGFNWLHLRSDDPGAIDYMKSIDLNPHLIEALSANETRPRMQELEDGVLINLRGVNTNPGADPEDMIAVRIWFNDHILISARKRDRRLLSIEDTRLLIEEGKGAKTPGEFVTTLVEKLANRINDVVDTIDEELTEIEVQLENSTNDVQGIQRKLSDSRKQTASIKRYLAPQKEALTELYRRALFLSPDECHDLRYQADRIIHYLEDLELVREKTLVLQGELQNKIAEQQNARTYVLSIVATIFLPLSFLTGVFGMNVAGLPGLEYPDAFNILTASMVFLAGLLIAYMWWKKWL
ncbi:MAG: zinc transporter [Planctomycetota bacterium]|jgi:zinc transporter